MPILAMTGRFRAITTWLTAAALLTHMAVGCCWHHQHGEVAEDCETAMGAMLPLADCAHSQAASGQHDQRSGEPCNEATCVTLLNSKAAVAASPAAAMRLQSRPHQSLHCAAEGRFFGARLAPLLPIRPHLWNQVLRI